MHQPHRHRAGSNLKKSPVRAARMMISQIADAKESHAMRIERFARTLLGAVALSWLLTSAACNGLFSNNNSFGIPAAVQAPGDWGMSLTAGATVGIGQFPAKFTFDVNATPDCVQDYVALHT